MKRELLALALVASLAAAEANARNPHHVPSESGSSTQSAGPDQIILPLRYQAYLPAVAAETQLPNFGPGIRTRKGYPMRITKDDCDTWYLESKPTDGKYLGSFDTQRTPELDRVLDEIAAKNEMAIVSTQTTHCVHNESVEIVDEAVSVELFKPMDVAFIPLASAGFSTSPGWYTGWLVRNGEPCKRWRLEDSPPHQGGHTITVFDAQRGTGEFGLLEELKDRKISVQLYSLECLGNQVNYVNDIDIPPPIFTAR